MGSHTSWTDSCGILSKGRNITAVPPAATCTFTMHVNYSDWVGPQQQVKINGKENMKDM